MVSILHLCPKKAQLQKQEATVCCETSYLHLIIVFCLFFFSKQSVHKHPRGRWAPLAGRPFLPHPPSLPRCPISCWSTSSLRFPPTTRWKKVFYSGNSACRTRCWLSEVLWLFRQLLGASGPTVKVFYRPSGLGTSSGSKKDRNDINRVLHCRPDTHIVTVTPKCPRYQIYHTGDAIISNFLNAKM